MIFKFYNPENGSILIDDKDIYKYSANSLYNNLTYVPQETILLHSTIYENIKIAKPNATKEEIYNAAKKAELHNFIESLEDKYNTIVGERGIKLSGGQRQRVAIARALINEPKILLADEPTGNLDCNTAYDIMQIFLELKEKSGQSTILVTHDPTIASYADRVLFLQDGLIYGEYEKQGNSGDVDEILAKFRESQKNAEKNR